MATGFTFENATERAAQPPSAIGFRDAESVAGLCSNAKEPSVWTIAFGTVVAWSFLAACTVIPFVQFLSLGYLLACQRRVALSGRWRDGFAGAAAFARFGTTIATWLLLLTPVLVFQWAVDQGVLASPTSHTYHWLNRLSPLVWTIAIAHIAISRLRGGAWSFVDPIGNGHWFFQTVTADPAMVGRVRRRLGEWLAWTLDQFQFAVRGYIAAGAWLVVPSLLLLASADVSMLRMVGGWLLAVVVPAAMLSAARFAATNSLMQAWNLREIIRLACRAPWEMLLSLAVLIALSIPVQIFKVERVPWELSIVFNFVCIASVWPGRILAAWCHYRGAQAKHQRGWSSIVTALPLCVALGMVYATSVYFMQYLSWLGPWMLFSHHPFLLPTTS